VAKVAIIVESPTKTRTLSGFLGSDYTLLASSGHVRDLPEEGLAVDVEHDFEPQYVVIDKKKKTISALRKALKGVDEIYLASDPDREGEAIAWHLAQVLELENPQRIEFNEITREAVHEALLHPRPIDEQRVNAQQARRILDRLVGYEISPFLWKRVGSRGKGPALSAGRVQSAALRLICDREREIAAFVPEEYWSVEVNLTPQGKQEPFTAQLRTRDGEELDLKAEGTVLPLVEELEQLAYQVTQVETKVRSRNPQAPFITSTLQRAAASQLGFSARKAMQVAQELYEGIQAQGEHVGLITYMRTDSTRLSEQAVTMAREYIQKEHGEKFVGGGAKGKKVKGAQDAHEAIRPTDVWRRPEQVRAYLDDDQAALYDLIWRRFVASQMAAAQFDQTTVDITAGPYGLRATGSRLKFPGYLAVMPETEEEPEVKVLAGLSEGQALDLLEVLPEQHFTKPPARFNEASLVQALEEHGIGRPSTYAAIIETLRQRKYVRMEKKAFIPTGTGFAVNDYLLQYFPHIMDIQFTARVEEDLDEIEEGAVNWVQFLKEYYQDLQQYMQTAQDSGPQYYEAQQCTKCGGRLVVKYSVRGPFAGCEHYPDCDYTLNLTPETASKPAPEPVGRDCPECGAPLVKRPGFRGRLFIACSGYPACTYKERLEANGAAGGEGGPIATDIPCDLCGQPLLLRESRRGKFLGCSGFPKCRNIRQIARLEQAEDGSITALEAAAPGERGSGDAARSTSATTVLDLKCEKCGAPMAVKKSKRGPFVACTGYPQCKSTAPMSAAYEAGYERPQAETLEEVCPECGKTLVVRSGRKGKFVGCSGYPKCNFTRNLSSEGQ
jgi:DNA topoisomerase-1